MGKEVLCGGRVERSGKSGVGEYGREGNESGTVMGSRVVRWLERKGKGEEEGTL